MDDLALVHFLIFLTSSVLLVSSSVESENNLENESTTELETQESLNCAFVHAQKTCTNTDEGLNINCDGMHRVSSPECVESPPSLTEDPIVFSETVTEQNFYFMQENKQICFTPKISSGDNWKGFFGYILEVEFFKTGSLEEKIISRLIVSFPQGLESTEVFGNTTACIETPGEIEFGETSFTSTVYTLTAGKSQIIPQSPHLKLSDVTFIEEEEDYEYVVPAFETTKKHIVVGVCEVILIFLSLIGLFGLCLKIYRRSQLRKEEEQRKAEA